jgi:hypothetical protein
MILIQQILKNIICVNREKTAAVRSVNCIFRNLNTSILHELLNLEARNRQNLQREFKA